MTYTDDDMLMLSGIQHFVFCPRQWALIDIEQTWADNGLTTEGRILHHNVDNPAYRQLNKGCITLRGLHVSSYRLGLYGITDAIELLPTQEDKFITHPRYPGKFIPYPVEYKRGHQKTDDCDIMQLVAQVMCLEEMFSITLKEGALFYWEVRRRERILIDDNLKDQALFYANEMHRIFKSGILPQAEISKKCRKCSLLEQCQPEIFSLQTVNSYLVKNLYEETT
ncbi:MAG: CRISPR-associated protein Cas4 [Bacteroidales bacterium]|nr:CRISPR-associated protein Cas4 [Bacteroidales bacterium]